MPEVTPPTCEACDDRMEVKERTPTLVGFECECGYERFVPKPNRVTPEFRRKYL